MTSHGDRVPLGDDAIDALINGGVPPAQGYLVAGPHGTGKTSFGMQFLQTGLDAGDRSLFIGIDQTTHQLQTTFASYDWTLDTDDLGVLSLTAQPGTVDGHQALTLDDLDDGRLFDAFHPGGTSEILTRYITQFAPVDRVVIDGIDTLDTFHETHSFTSTFVDILRLLTQEFSATVLFTAANETNLEPVPTLVSGKFSLTRHPDRPTHAATFQVSRLHGIEYDPRPLDLEFTAQGVHGKPRHRGLSTRLSPTEQVSVGIPGLDRLTGGGLIAGDANLLTHDGSVTKAPLLAAFIAALHEQEYAVTLLPTLDLRPTRLAEFLNAHDLDMRGLLADGELYVVDFTEAWDAAESNVYGATDDRSQLEGVLREVDELTAGRRATIASADVLTHTFSDSDVRTLRYYQEGQLLGDTDVLVHLLNPDVVGTDLAAFFTDTANQVLHLELGSGGRSRLSVTGGPTGAVGATTLLEHIDEPPFVAVDAPPISDTNTEEG